jgi:hypothetical protein
MYGKENLTMKHLFTVCTLVAVCMAAVLVGPTSSLAASAQDRVGTQGACYAGAKVYPYQLFITQEWTWRYGYDDGKPITASSRCADLNVRVDNLRCSLYVDAQYYKSSTGQWIDGAYDDKWIPNGQWYAPIRNVRDGTPMRVRFKASCTDRADLKIAA